MEFFILCICIGGIGLIGSGIIVVIDHFVNKKKKGDNKNA